MPQLTYSYSCTSKCFYYKCKSFISFFVRCLYKLFVFVHCYFFIFRYKCFSLDFYHLDSYIRPLHHFTEMIDCCQIWINAWYLIFAAFLKIVFILKQHFFAYALPFGVCHKFFNIPYIFINRLYFFFRHYQHFPKVFKSAAGYYTFLTLIIITYPFSSYIPIFYHSKHILLTPFND